ncbi:deacylase, partial [Halorubrum tibetense]
MDPTDAPIELGTASAAPGEVDRGWLDVADLPTGTAERLPVIVANGVDPGPTLWLTGGVHGDEATGVAVVLDTVEALSTAADGPRPLDDLAGC